MEELVLLRSYHYVIKATIENYDEKIRIAVGGALQWMKDEIKLSKILRNVKPISWMDTAKH